VDTGPLVALLDRGDPAHSRVDKHLERLGSSIEMLTTWPVITEACHLLARHLVLPFMRWAAAGGVQLHEMPATALDDLTTLMDKYADRPMDMADASLVWLADQSGVHDILTLDATDFAIYRLSSGQRLRNILRH